VFLCSVCLQILWYGGFVVIMKRLKSYLCCKCWPIYGGHYYLCALGLSTFWRLVYDYPHRYWWHANYSIVFSSVDIMFFKRVQICTSSVRLFILNYYILCFPMWGSGIGYVILYRLCYIVLLLIFNIGSVFFASHAKSTTFMTYALMDAIYFRWYRCQISNLSMP